VGQSATLAPNKLGLVAIILAGVGFLFAILPPTSGLAWILLIPAVVLGIIGLNKKGQKKGTSLAALILGVVGWILSIIVFFASAVSLLGSAVDSAGDPPAVTSPDGQTDEVADAAGIGDTVTSGEGVSFTVNAVTCGLATVGESFAEETAKGEFCEVKFTLLNGTDESINVSGYNFTGAIDTAEYDSNSVANKFGEDYFATDVNPGLSTDGAIYFDIPVGSALDTVTYAGLFTFDDDLTIKVS
jgi:hypothetical protein